MTRNFPQRGNLTTRGKKKTPLLGPKKVFTKKWWGFAQGPQEIKKPGMST